MQKTTRASSTHMDPPVVPPIADTGAGEMMNVVSDLVGISSGIMSTSFLVPQNSHTQTCMEQVHEGVIHVALSPGSFPAFQCWMLKTWEEPGDEAKGVTWMCVYVQMTVMNTK